MTRTRRGASGLRVADRLRVERSRGPTAAVPPEPVLSPPAAPSYATAAASPATRSSGHSLVFKSGDDVFAKGRLSDMAQAAQFNFRSADRERVLLTSNRVAVDMPVGATGRVSDAVHAAKHNAELHGKVELLVSALRAAHGRATQQVQWPGCTIPPTAALAPIPSASTFDLPPPPKQHKAGVKSGGRGPGKGSGGSSSGSESDSNGWRRSNDSGAGWSRQGGRPRDASSDRRQAGGHQRGGGSDQRQRGRAPAAAATSDMILFWKIPSPFRQWTPSTFVVDGVYYLCAEQFFAAEKACFFGDTHILQCIMRVSDPSLHNKYGREVSGFDQTLWEQERENIVLTGS